MKEAEQQAVFSSWLQDYRPLLFKVVRAYATNVADQEDLFQEIALQLWRSVASFRGASKVSTWIYRIALNTALKWSSRETRRLHRRAAIHDQQNFITEAPAEMDDRLRWLYEEIGQMHHIDRSLTLLLLDGFSYKEMAEILGISVSNVGVKINRIKKRLTKRAAKINFHGVQ